MRLENRRERSMRLYAERQLAQATEDIDRLAEKARQAALRGSTVGAIDATVEADQSDRPSTPN